MTSLQGATLHTRSLVDVLRPSLNATVDTVPSSSSVSNVSHLPIE